MWHAIVKIQLTNTVKPNRYAKKFVRRPFARARARRRYFYFSFTHASGVILLRAHCMAKPTTLSRAACSAFDGRMLIGENNLSRGGTLRPHFRETRF